MRTDLRSVVYGARCPRCGATPGSRCTGLRYGAAHVTTHTQRWDRWFGIRDGLIDLDENEYLNPKGER